MYTAGYPYPGLECMAQIVCVSYDGPRISVDNLTPSEAVDLLSGSGALCRHSLARALDEEGLQVMVYEPGPLHLAVHAIAAPALAGAVATGMRLLRGAEEGARRSKGARSTLRFLMAYTGVLAPLAGLHVYLVWRSMLVPRGVLLGTALALVLLGAALPVSEALDTGGSRLHPRALAGLVAVVALILLLLPWALPRLACYSAALAPYTSVDSIVTGTMMLLTLLAPLGLLQVQDTLTSLYVAYYALTLAAGATAVLAVLLVPLLGPLSLLVWASALTVAVLCYKVTCEPPEQEAPPGHGWAS